MAGSGGAGIDRDYRTAYPGRLLRKQRLERLKEQGRPFCPACGAELPPAEKPDGARRCLRCGGWIPAGAGKIPDAEPWPVPAERQEHPRRRVRRRRRTRRNPPPGTGGTRRRRRRRK